MLLREGRWPPGALTPSPHPPERPQHAGEAVATAAAGAAPLLRQAEDRRGHEQPETGEGPAEVGAGVAGGAVHGGGRTASKCGGTAGGVGAGAAVGSCERALVCRAWGA